MPVSYALTRALAIRGVFLAFCISSIFAIFPAPAILAGPGGEGHTHGEEAAPVSGSLSPRVSLRGDIYDAVAIYKNGQITLYVDLLSDNSPITDANVDLALGSHSGQLTAGPDGVFRMDVDGLAAGAHEVIAAVTGPAGEDLLAGTLQIGAATAGGPSAHAHGTSSLRELVSRVAHGVERRTDLLVFGAGSAAGFLIAIMAAVGRRRSAAILAAFILLVAFAGPSLAGPGGDGHSHGDEAASPLASDAPHRLPDGSLFIPKPTQRLLEIRTAKTETREAATTISLPARVIADPHRSSVVQSVNGGRILIAGDRLPTLGHRVTKGQLLALVEPPINAADESTISDRSNEITQQITIAELRLQRSIVLAAKNAAPTTQVTDLQAEIEALKGRRADLRQRRSPEELRAPTAGMIAAVSVIAGQVVASQDQLFRIVDPNSMWLEAVAFSGFKSPVVAEAIGIIEGVEPFALKLEGVGPVLQSHATKLQFSIDAAVRMMAGQPARVLVKTAQTEKGVVVPREAVVRGSNGQTVVWSHTSSERFAPVSVRGEPLDGKHYVVRAGLEPGLSVVVRGAELLNQVR